MPIHVDDISFDELLNFLSDKYKFDDWVNYFPMPHPVQPHNNHYIPGSKTTIEVGGNTDHHSRPRHHNNNNSNQPDPIDPNHPNFVWKNINDAHSDNVMNNRYYELSPLFPFVMILIVSTLIFIVIVYKRWPGLVAGIIAGCLTSVSIYMLLLTLKEQRIVYE